MPSKHPYLGIDIGGTSVKMALVTNDRQILRRHSFATKIELGLLGQSTLFDYWRQEFLNFLGTEQVQAAGVGVPGILERKQGLLLESPNLKPLVGIALQPILEQWLRVPVTLENDVNTFTWGEYLLNWQHQCRNLVALVLGTGVGGGIISNGYIYTGKGNAGELGHICIDYNGLDCQCGAKGCLEQYASVSALVRHCQRFLHIQFFASAKPWPAFWQKYMEDNELDSNDPYHWKLNGKIISNAAANGDATALLAFEQLAFYLGIALASYANIFDPEVIVIGGGILPAQHFFLPQSTAIFQQRAMAGIKEKTRIVAAMSADAALIGSSLLCYDNKRSSNASSNC